VFRGVAQPLHILERTQEGPLPEHHKNNQTTYEKEHHNETDPNETSKVLHLTCFSFDFHNFRGSSVVDFNPVAHVRGQQRLAERGNPTDGVSFEIEFVDADDG